MEFCGDVEEEDLPQMLDPLGVPVSTSTFVDSDHASNFSPGYHIQVYYCLFVMV